MRYLAAATDVHDELDLVTIPTSKREKSCHYESLLLVAQFLKCHGRHVTGELQLPERPLVTCSKFRVRIIGHKVVSHLSAEDNMADEHWATFSIFDHRGPLYRKALVLFDRVVTPVPTAPVGRVRQSEIDALSADADYLVDSAAAVRFD